MIESGMFFALGVFVSGLVALAILRALVRRTRRVTEKYLHAAVATRRGEFQAERDELKARHAVTIRQLERESDTFRDLTTAHRLEADLKDQENADLRADLNARDIEVEELTDRFHIVQDTLLQAERNLAESGGALRTARHALESEAGRRADLRDRLAEMTRLAERRRLEIVGLQAEIARLRSRMGLAAIPDLPANGYGDADPLRLGIVILRPSSDTSTPADPIASAMIPASGPVSPILERPANGITLPEGASARPPSEAAEIGMASPRPDEAPADTAAEAPDAPEAENIRRIASEIHRIAGEAAADLERGVWRNMAHPPEENAPPEQVNGGAAQTHSGIGPPQADSKAGGQKRQKPDASASQDNVESMRRSQNVKAAEVRFMNALEEIRALRRAAGPAGE